MSVVRTLIGNVKGPKGDTGSQGPQGVAGTIEIGSVQTVSYGSPASVTNSGTEEEAILDFQIPQGAPGEHVKDMKNLVLGAITDSTADYPTFAVSETGSTIFGKIRKFLSDLKNNYVSKAMMTTSTDVDTAGQAVADAKAIKSLNDSLANLSTNVSTNYATKAALANTDASIANLKNGTDAFSGVTLDIPGSSNKVAVQISNNGFVSMYGATANNVENMQVHTYLQDKYGSISSRYRTRESASAAWGDWSSYGYMYPIRHKDINGTTDSNGYINLNIDVDTTLPILADTRKGGGSLSDRFVEFTSGASSWWGRVTYKGATVASTAIKFRIWYFDAQQTLV